MVLKKLGVLLQTSSSPDKLIFGIGFTTNGKTTVAGQVKFCGLITKAVTFCVPVMNGSGNGLGSGLLLPSKYFTILPVCPLSMVASKVEVSKAYNPSC